MTGVVQGQAAALAVVLALDPVLSVPAFDKSSD